MKDKEHETEGREYSQSMNEPIMANPLLAGVQLQLSWFNREWVENIEEHLQDAGFNPSNDDCEIEVKWEEHFQKGYEAGKKLWEDYSAIGGDLSNPAFYYREKINGEFESEDLFPKGLHWVEEHSWSGESMLVANSRSIIPKS